jgi:hypothetical protein
MSNTVISIILFLNRSQIPEIDAKNPTAIEER